MKEVIHEYPLTSEIYCYLGESQGKYHTLMVSPLFKYFLAKKMIGLAASVGRHLFRYETDQPVYLIPYDDKVGLSHAVKVEELKLFDGPVPEDMHPTIILPFEFSLTVEPFLHYKLFDGELFKKVNNEWRQELV